MKTCFKCEVAQPLSEFYAHKQMADGHLNKCKACSRVDVAARLAVITATPDGLEKELERHRIKSRRAREQGRDKPARGDVKREQITRNRRRYPERARARVAVGRAVRAGVIVRTPCIKCGSADSEAHHEDYSKPLEVVWLCPKHHGERHVEIRRQARLSKLQTL